MQPSGRFLYCTGFLVLFSMTISVQAKTFFLSSQDTIIGQVEVTTSKAGDDFAHIARDYDMGYTELVEANPQVDPEHVPAGTVLVIPSQFILPQAPKRGIVINVAEMRLYFYPDHSKTVITYPIGVGRAGEDTPPGALKVIERVINPSWIPTATMRELRAQEGVTLPTYMPPGPDNPLGAFKLRLSNPTYLIHGTNDPFGGIGRRSSSGCIRLYPEDIAALFQQVKLDTPVYIINQPYKAGWLDKQFYFEAHVGLENEQQGISDVDKIQEVIAREIGMHPANISWEKVIAIAKEMQGLPQVVGVKS